MLGSLLLPSALALVLPLALLAVATPAAAQVDQQLTALNTEALEAYQNLDIDTARAKLEQAVDMATQSGFVGPELAQVFMSLGVVHVAGASDSTQGLAAFTNAICTQSDVQLDPLLSTPEVQQVFMQAQQNAQSGACGAGGAAVPPPTEYVAPPPSDVAADAYDDSSAIDEECPPGVVCGEGDGESSRGSKDFARWFVNLQFVLGLPFVQPGMPADSKPAFDEIFTTLDVPVDSNGDGAFDSMDDENMDGVQDTESRYYFDDKSGWVPDADSFDDYEDPEFNIPRAVTPVSAQCAADGTVTGPPGLTDVNGNPQFSTLEPSSYCVRVASSGFVPNAALRINPGYFVTDSFAVSMPLRVAFNSGEGSLSALLIGLRGELLFSEMDEPTGFPVSWFFGATYGQIQAQPPPKDPSRKVPFVSSGPLGLHTGLNVRMRVHRNFGFILSPELDLQVPDLLFNIDLAAGVEAAF